MLKYFALARICKCTVCILIKFEALFFNIKQSSAIGLLLLQKISNSSKNNSKLVLPCFIYAKFLLYVVSFFFKY